jgi:hypothetical protein
MKSQQLKFHKPERDQKALYAAIVGLLITLYGLNMKDEMVGNVVALFGVACAVVSVAYWIFRPRHGLGG